MIHFEISNIYVIISLRLRNTPLIGTSFCVFTHINYLEAFNELSHVCMRLCMGTCMVTIVRIQTDLLLTILKMFGRKRKTSKKGNYPRILSKIRFI